MKAVDRSRALAEHLGDSLSGASIRRLMRINHKTIRDIAQEFNLPMTRVRYVREHGVTGIAFVCDWIQATCGEEAARAYLQRRREQESKP